MPESPVSCWFVDFVYQRKEGEMRYNYIKIQRYHNKMKEIQKRIHENAQMIFTAFQSAKG